MTSLGNVRLRAEERQQLQKFSRKLIELKANRQPNANFDAPPNFRYWGVKRTWRGRIRMSAYDP